MNELVRLDGPTGGASEAATLAAHLQVGMNLDRAATKKLLRTLEKMDSEFPGCRIMQAQLRGILDRRDWLLISITADARTVRESGVSLGIVQAKAAKATRLTPMQKWQRKIGARR